MSERYRQIRRPKDLSLDLFHNPRQKGFESFSCATPHQLRPDGTVPPGFETRVNRLTGRNYILHNACGKLFSTGPMTGDKRLVWEMWRHFQNCEVIHEVVKK